eukprot:COSAG02_NODE_59832_length_273_cov_0.591954_1_plen_38_part_10
MACNPAGTRSYARSPSACSENFLEFLISDCRDFYSTET